MQGARDGFRKDYLNVRRDRSPGEQLCLGGRGGGSVDLADQALLRRLEAVVMVAEFHHLQRAGKQQQCNRQAGDAAGKAECGEPGGGHCWCSGVEKPQEYSGIGGRSELQVSKC